MYTEYIPLLFILLLVAGILWIIWRLVRRLFGSPASRQEPAIGTDPEPDVPPRDLVPRPVTASSPVIPDAADVLALKAAIDNLARQVAALESRLASGNNTVPLPHPASASRATDPAGVAMGAPPIIADRR